MPSLRVYTHFSEAGSLLGFRVKLGSRFRVSMRVSGSGFRGLGFGGLGV